MATIDLARIHDLEWLAARDLHVSPEVLARKLEAGEVLLAIDRAAPVGWLRWGFFWDQIPFANLLVVIQGARGQGVGRALVTAWENRMAHAGHRRVMTSTLSNESAQHFYRKLGYEDRGALLLPGEPLEILFVKTLGATEWDGQ